ncbi:tetratricopeptide repeat protein [Salinicola sp. JS01]|uniref:YfgM family protein n=1 Tax=Salinicola sp. JS01 TaxID=3050071 RepID=UPI00255BFD3D|nr:tetratricopeptide repeat protein [Salinicola sp. JS01]WIX31632.1 tetratricopeptide repeat protein [Salinicola sp. JS01]
MAELRSEEEQLDAIKEWWKSNGTALLVGIVVAAALVLGWHAWQRHQENQSAEASVTYQQLIAIAASDSIDDKARTQAFELADKLESDHSGTLYADLAGLIEAKLAVGANDDARARKALEPLIADSDRPYMQGLAKIELARLQIAAKDADSALKTLDGSFPEALEAQRQAVRGDAFVALDRNDDASQAYQEAQNLAQASDQTLYGLQLKLDDLGAKDATP